MRLSGTGKTTPQAQGRAHGHLVLLVWEPSLPCRAWAPAWGLWVTVPVKGSQGDPSDSWSSRKMIWGPYPPSPPLALVPLLRNPNISTQCRTPDQACRLCPQGDPRIEMSLSALTVPWPPPNVTLAEPSPSWGFQWREELRATLGTVPTCRSCLHLHSSNLSSHLPAHASMQSSSSLIVPPGLSPSGHRDCPAGTCLHPRPWLEPQFRF